MATVRQETAATATSAPGPYLEAASSCLLSQRRLTVYMQQWLMWYRQGELSEVLRRVVGHHAKGKKPYLNQLQQRALVAKVQLGEFRTVWDVIEWVRGRWGVSYTYQEVVSATSAAPSIQ